MHRSYQNQLNYCIYEIQLLEGIEINEDIDFKFSEKNRNINQITKMELKNPLFAKKNPNKTNI